MSPDFFQKWEHILQDVEKSRIPVEFIKKIVLKLKGRKQFTINIQVLLKQGLDPQEVEEVVNRKLTELDEIVLSVEFILNVQHIAEIVQPETDRILNKLE